MEAYEEHVDKNINTNLVCLSNEDNNPGSTTDSNDNGKWDFYHFVLNELRARHNDVWNNIMYIGGGSAVAFLTGIILIRCYRIK